MNKVYNCSPEKLLDIFEKCYKELASEEPPPIYTVINGKLYDLVDITIVNQLKNKQNGNCNHKRNK